MNQKYKVLATAIIGGTLLAGAILPVVSPDNSVSAKWFNWANHNSKEVENSSDKTAMPYETPEAKVAYNEGQTTAEVVITTKEGGAQRLTIESDKTAPIAVAIDKEVSEELQRQSKKADRAWLLDPVQVTKNYAYMYGFDAEQDVFTLVSQVYKGSKTGTGEASVLVKHSDKYYLVGLTQPNGPGNNKIWQVNSIKEVKVISNTINDSKHDKVDVGPGVEGLDYDKVVKWQQNVDAGRELWRLDPIQVAKTEGRRYGFNDSDAYTVIRKLNSSTIARHGQIDIQVNHDGKLYTIILVKPFGGEGAIWTIYKVADKQPPVTVPDKKVLFETNKFNDWKWQKGQYPQDMAFATVVDYYAQLKQDNRIPQFALEKLKDVDFDNKVALFAYLGTAPSGGYGIGIETVTMSGNNITVQVRTKSPKPSDMVTMMVAYPSDFVLIDRNTVDIWGGVNVTFVDQNGQMLSKNRIVINHLRSN